MPKEYEIYHLEFGLLDEHDEYWTLVVPEDGAPIVRHGLFWRDLSGGEVKQSPPQEVPLKAFLTEHSYGTVRDNLIRILQQLGINPNA